jgi:hypothetical protein
MALFNDTRKKSKSKLHYGSANKARQTIKYLKTRPKRERLRSAYAMYHRAKYHAKQTANMQEAMNVYENFIWQTKKMNNA